jgi:hypothetical protein
MTDAMVGNNIHLTASILFINTLLFLRVFKKGRMSPGINVDPIA